MGLGGRTSAPNNALGFLQNKNGAETRDGHSNGAAA